MGSLQTVVCVKKVKQEAMEDWDESMPLPGDIIEGLAEGDATATELFVPAKAKSDLSSHLGKISQQLDVVYLKVRRGDSTLKLRARIVREKASIWRLKVDMHLPDHRSSAISSILFTPLQGEHSIESTTRRCMAWFSAAVSSGAPLVFVNIQSEQIVNVPLEKNKSTGRESWWSRQQNNTQNVRIEQGIRLWFLPGVSEVPLEMVPAAGEVRFGMDIQRTEEGFICVSAVTNGSAADRSGLGKLLEEAKATNYLLLISRLEGKSLIPSNVSSTGLIHCCDHAEIRSTLVSAMDRMDSVQLHVMSCPDCSDAAQDSEASKVQTTCKLFPPRTVQGSQHLI